MKRSRGNELIASLREFIARQRAQAFEDAMARMAADPDIRAECAAISTDFDPAALDALPRQPASSKAVRLKRKPT